MAKYEQTTTTTQLLKWVCESRSTWYYKEKTGKRGRKPSTHARHKDGHWVTNEEIVIQIKAILSVEFVFYGYDLVTEDLREDLGFISGFITSSEKNICRCEEIVKMFKEDKKNNLP